MLARLVGWLVGWLAGWLVGCSYFMLHFPLPCFHQRPPPSISFHSSPPPPPPPPRPLTLHLPHIRMCFIICTWNWSAQLSMFHMERRSRNTIIITIINIFVHLPSSLCNIFVLKWFVGLGEFYALSTATPRDKRGPLPQS